MARLTLNPARPAYSVPAVPFVDMAIGYTVDELDDLTSRKVAPEGIDGDRLAMLIRARRGTARANRAIDSTVLDAVTINDNADWYLWNHSTRDMQADGNRRMAAVGGTGKHGGVETVSATFTIVN